jgi:ribokinase
MSSIVVVGSLNMDLVAVAPHLPLAGETLIGSKYWDAPGGKGGNQAYAAAKLGADVSMLGRVGQDNYGSRMRANLESVGCDTRGLKTIEGSSGVALIFLAGTGQNSIIVVSGANDRYTPADVLADRQRLVGAKLMLLQLENPYDTVTAAAKLGREAGARVVLDPAPAPAPSSLPDELLRAVDIMTPNETEAARLAGSPATTLSLDEAHVIARKLQSMGPKTVIMKLGEQGCLLLHGEVATPVAAPKVTALDTTAAGDEFNGAFAVAIAEGATLADACRFAVHAAALSVTKLGSQASMPSRLEFDRFYKSG